MRGCDARNDRTNPNAHNSNGKFFQTLAWVRRYLRIKELSAHGNSGVGAPRSALPKIVPHSWSSKPPFSNLNSLLSNYLLNVLNCGLLVIVLTVVVGLDNVEAGKGTYGGPDRKGCNTDAGKAQTNPVQKEGQERVWYRGVHGEAAQTTRSSPSGAAFMLDARLGSVHKIKQAKERGTRGEGEPKEPAGEGEEEHDRNANKLPNLGGQSTTMYGPSMAAGASAGSGQRAAGCGAKR
ncbi:hypothetical protein B0H13DRAFT_1862936 [Mycena leptocephala]|nr:hypothetical protein B0H13DRAFT_1862936 [Mycena leptocephala]